MKKKLLVNIEHNELIDVLEVVYIKTDFVALLENYLEKIKIPANIININYLRTETIRNLYLILVDNVYSYLADNNISLFFDLISKRLLCDNIYIRVLYITNFIDFINKNYGVLYFVDKDDVYFETKKLMEKAIKLAFEDNNIYEGMVQVMYHLMQNITIYEKTDGLVYWHNKVLFL